MYYFFGFNDNENDANINDKLYKDVISQFVNDNNNESDEIDEKIILNEISPKKLIIN